jgi:hypothetical protein
MINKSYIANELADLDITVRRMILQPTDQSTRSLYGRIKHHSLDFVYIWSRLDYGVITRSNN